MGDAYEVMDMMSRSSDPKDAEIQMLREKLKEKQAEFDRMENAWRREVDKVRRGEQPGRALVAVERLANQPGTYVRRTDLRLALMTK